MATIRADWGADRMPLDIRRNRAPAALLRLLDAYDQRTQELEAALERVAELEGALAHRDAHICTDACRTTVGCVVTRR